MPEDPMHLTFYDAHEFDYDRRLFEKQRQVELENQIAQIIERAYRGNNLGGVAERLLSDLSMQFPVRAAVLVETQRNLLQKALADCLFDWHMDLGTAPSSASYWQGLAPEILKRVIFTLAPDFFDLGLRYVEYGAMRFMTSDRLYIEAELLHHYDELLPSAYAKTLTWTFFHEKYPREAAECPCKVETWVCEVISQVLTQWKASHQGAHIAIVDDLKAQREQDLKKRWKGQKLVLLNTACMP
jgi:hypothetical protein